MAFFAFACSGPFIGLAILWLWRWRSRRVAKRNPLTRDLLRRPGQSLQEQVEDLSLDILSDLFVMMFLSPLAALGLAFYSDLMGPRTIVELAFLGGVGYFGFRVLRGLKRRAKLRLGLDGEMATGEELSQLMLRGCRVFHDFPADKFNIDHVVAGPGGVFAVETKARAKPNRRMGKLDALVTCEGGTLHFPGWQEKKPLEQAVSQAAWLEGWLTHAVGELVHVQPALALPGWFVERKGSGGPIVFNPKNSTLMAEPRGGSGLSASLLQRISHQLEQRCRDVAPKAFVDRKPS